MPEGDRRSSNVAEENELRLLFIAAQAGDKERYREFLERIQLRLKRYLLRALPNDVLAEDCLQEILLSIHRMRNSYDKDRPLLAWVHAITRNKVIDFYRSGARRSERVLASTDLVETGEGRENVATQVEDRELLEKLLGSISEEFTKPLILTRLKGYTIAEAAQELGISESLVKVRVHRATRKLSQVMQSEDWSEL